MNRGRLVRTQLLGFQVRLGIEVTAAARQRLSVTVPVTVGPGPPAWAADRNTPPAASLSTRNSMIQFGCTSRLPGDSEFREKNRKERKNIKVCVSARGGRDWLACP